MHKRIESLVIQEDQLAAPQRAEKLQHIPTLLRLHCSRSRFQVDKEGCGEALTKSTTANHSSLEWCAIGIVACILP